MHITHITLIGSLIYELGYTDIGLLAIQNINGTGSQAVGLNRRNRNRSMQLMTT